MELEALAERLRVARARQKLTLVEAAEKIGISRHTLRGIELGHRHPTAETLGKISAGYGIPVAELVKEEPALAGKAEAPPSLEPSFNDVLEEEKRRDRARVLIPYMDSAAREGKKVAEEIKASPDDFPHRRHDVFSGWCWTLWVAYREVAERGGLLPELEDAFGRLALVWEDVSTLAGIAWGEEGDLAYQDLVRAARRAREAASAQARQGRGQATA